jgi:hypothetical protein
MEVLWHQCPRCFWVEELPNDPDVPKAYECPSCFEPMVLIDLRYRPGLRQIDEAVILVRRMLEETASENTKMAADHPQAWRRYGGAAGGGLRIEVLAEVRDRLVTRGIEMFEES